MKKTKKPVRVEIIKPAERRALRQTGKTGTVRTLAREEEAAARENYKDMVAYEKEAVEHLSQIEKCLAEGSAE